MPCVFSAVVLPQKGKTGATGGSLRGFLRARDVKASQQGLQEARPDAASAPLWPGLVPETSPHAAMYISLKTKSSACRWSPTQDAEDQAQHSHATSHQPRRHLCNTQQLANKVSLCSLPNKTHRSCVALVSRIEALFWTAVAHTVIPRISSLGLHNIKAQGVEAICTTPSGHRFPSAQLTQPASM